MSDSYTGGNGLETKYYRLERLVKWEHIDEVNEMLMTPGISPKRVSEWCDKMGFKISHPKLYEYREILRTAVAKQITVERLMGIGVPKRSPIILQALGINGDIKNRVKNELEVLDSIIQQGFNVLQTNPEIKIADAMRAIELKNKITQGAHGGLTNYGLDHLRELEAAKMQAIIQVVMKYLPEDKYEELESEIEQAERTFYEENAPELLLEYEKATEAMLENSNNGEDTIVSDTMF